MNKNPSPATRFQPGQTGNPQGSSRKAQDRAEFTAALTKLLAENGAAGKFLQAGWDAALAGDFQFWRYLWERLEGKTATPEPGPQLDLESVSRAMAERYKQIRPEGPPETEPPLTPFRGPARNGLVELPAQPATPRPTAVGPEPPPDREPPPRVIVDLGDLPEPLRPTPAPAPPLDEPPGPEPTRPFLDFGGLCFYPQEN